MLAENNKGRIRDRAAARRRAPVKPPAANRWSTWARSIATRHARFTQRRDSLALIVRRSKSPVQVIRMRWLLTKKLIRPHLQLAINAVVNLAHWRQEQHFSHELNKLFSHTNQQFLKLRGVPAQQQSQRGRSERVVREPGQAGTSTSTQRSMYFREQQRRIFNQPLAFVFQRVNVSKSSSHTNRLEILIHQQVRSVVERVTQQSRRTETMFIGTNSLIERQMVSTRTEANQSPSRLKSMPPARLFKTMPAPARVIEKSAPAVPVTTVIESAPWLQEKMPAAGLNIDQITDQVVRQLDRRVIAARERMGRV